MDDTTEKRIPDLISRCLGYNDPLKDWIASWIEKFRTKCLKESTPGDVRLQAFMELIEVGKPAVPALIGTLHDWGNVTDAAIDAFGEIGKPSIPVLIEAVKDEDWQVRANAVRALGRIRDASVVPALTEALEDEQGLVGGHAAIALGVIGDASAVPALIGALRDEDRDVRGHAAWALAEIARKSESIEDFEAVENGIVEGSKALRKQPRTGVREIEAQQEVVSWLKRIAQKKNELAPKRDLLLPDTVKPPKKGNVYNVMRRVRNG